MLKSAVQFLTAVATGAAVVKGASIVMRGAKVATKAASDRLAGLDLVAGLEMITATTKNKQDLQKMRKDKRKESRKESRKTAKDFRKRAAKAETRLRKGAKLASGTPAEGAKPASRVAARQAMLSRRMRQLSSALEKQSDEAASRDADLADALMEQSAAIAQIAESPPESAAEVGDPIVSQLIEALSRSGGDDVKRMASDLAARRVPEPAEYGFEADEETVFDVVMGWSDEDPDAVGSHCACGSGGVCGCSLAGAELGLGAASSISPKAAEAILVEDPVAGTGWENMPNFARPFGYRQFDAVTAMGGHALSSGGCKTGMCPMPK